MSIKQAKSSKQKLLSIIIPTKNEEKNIGRIIQSITASKEYNPKLFEVIVIDNPGTTDKTRIIAKKLDAIVSIVGPERSTQRNTGATIANGKYIYFVDADMEFSDNLLKEIVLKLSKNPQNLGFVVPERIPGNSTYCRAVNIEKQIYDGNETISACRIFSKQMFDKVGGYNPDLIMGEDWDLDKRLKKAGLNIEHLKHHVWHHEADIGFWGSVKKKLYYAKNLKNMSVGMQAEVSPFYRYGILFSKPWLILKDPFAFIYLICLKTTQFALGITTLYIKKLLK